MYLSLSFVRAGGGEAAEGKGCVYDEEEKNVPRFPFSPSGWQLAPARPFPLPLSTAYGL